MRKILSKGFILEFVSLLALLVTVVSAWVGSLLNLPSEAVISASVGVAVAAYIWALKWEFRREIQDKVSLFALLEQIQDDELYARGKTAIEKCRMELENLSKGILRLETGQLFRYLIQVTESARHSVQTTQLVLDEKFIDLLQASDEKPWYQQNVKLVRQGVTFERFFILAHSIAIDSGSGKLKPNLANLLQKQEKDGLNVRVVWQEDIEDPELVQDFAAIDSKTVLVTNPAWVGGYNNVIVYRRKFDVERYIEIFEALRSKGYSLSELSELT